MRWMALLIVFASACASAPVERVSLEEVLGAPAGRSTAEHGPVASRALLERLQGFVATADALREATPRGAPMPAALVSAWTQVLDEVDGLGAKQMTTLDLVRTRLWLQTALEADGARFGDVEMGIALRAQRTVASLTAALAAQTTARRPRRANPATFTWPVDPVVVTSPWGHRLHPVHGDARFHAGIDLEAHRAQPIYAAGPGVVAFAGWNSGHGKQVEVQHDAHLATRYSHLSVWSVSPGDVVKKGDVIGLAGRTGTATGVHLHFELRRDGQPVDPEDELPSAGIGNLAAAP